MQIQGEQRVPVDPQQTWQALNDPAVLQACIPGCQVFERDGGGGFNTVIGASVGPVKAHFKGHVALSEVVADQSCRLSFRGEGSSGLVSGSSRIRLEAADDGNGTWIRYTAEAALGGKLGKLGAPLIDRAADRLVEKFFTRLAQQLGGVDPALEAVEDPPRKGKRVSWLRKRRKPREDG